MAFLLAAIALIFEIIYWAQTKTLELWFIALTLITLAVLALTYRTITAYFPGTVVRK